MVIITTWIFMQIYILTNTSGNIEFKQRFVSSIKNYNKYSTVIICRVIKNILIFLNFVKS